MHAVSRLQAELPIEKPKLNEATLPPSEANIERSTQIPYEEIHAVWTCIMNGGNTFTDSPYKSFRRFVDKCSETALHGATEPNTLLQSIKKRAALLEQSMAKLDSDGMQATNAETRCIDLQVAASLATELRQSVAALLLQCATGAKLQNGAKNRSRKKGGGVQSELGSKRLPNLLQTPPVW